MSKGFNTAAVSNYARTHGITYEEACSRFAQRARRRRSRPYPVNQTAQPQPKRPLWWLRD